jgi:hypothetical protein
MHLEKLNPAAPCRALAGSGSLISSAAINPDNITTALVLKKILGRVAVSPSVALIMAKHAGLLREAR